ncbi:glycosyltransferase [Poseidonocella sedimentorum]|uniref:Glycosyl transferases group 1 n=1 Tax=Poseidonocella sedimentorum TaxID=871652 RepID=A0A1I6ENC5_9RHOB|nr:glycosyltransferase [Poseidonocella sedimentorum]SFR19239.1 Glycosyl transferases group 1 [Poseidonocella sedimentorum]
MRATADLDRRAGAAMAGRARPVAARWLARPFPRGARCRVLIYYTTSAICWSQVYPFVHYAEAFARRHGAAVRCLPVERFLTGARGPEADVVLIQPWFTTPPEALAQALERFAAHHPRARLSFLDSFAHNDLRLGPVLADHIRFYLKKSLFRDRRLYLRAWRGDTNLTEYYSALYGIDPGPPVERAVPEALLDRLRLCPSFFTAPRFMSGFDTPPPPQAGRGLDVQSRLGARGTPWYSAMRAAAQARIAGIEGLSLSPPGSLSLPEFMAELADARLCFSPFGYGELCWRDVEAFQAGAVLVKPDMGHLETAPELYDPGETYLPIRWDFADLEETLRGALADEETRSRIARTAHARIAAYIAEERFVDDMDFLFSDQ